MTEKSELEKAEATNMERVLDKILEDPQEIEKAESLCRELTYLNLEDGLKSFDI